MKPGDLVRIDYRNSPEHGGLGMILRIDKSMTLWPHDRIYYEVLLATGDKKSYTYDRLVFDGDGYFFDDEYYAVQKPT